MRKSLLDKMKRYLLLLCLCLSFVYLKAQSNIDTLRLSDYLSTIEQNGQCIGSLAIMKDGKNIYTRRLGKDLLRNKQEIEYPLYRVGSITKMFTAVLIYQEIEKGRLKLEDKLSDYFPEIPRAGDITIYQLLEHTAGLGDYVMKNGTYSWMLSYVPNSDIMEEIICQGILYEPGTDFKYSNSGYYLLANILRKIHKKAYCKILDEEIIRPLGLLVSASGIISDSDEALPYEKNAAGEWAEVPDFYFLNVMGVGDILSSPENINLFLHALFTGKLISKEHLQIMKPYGDDRHGRGMMYMPYHEHKYYGHTGDTFGVHSIGVYNEQEDISIAVSVNGSTIPFSEFLLGIFDSIYGK